MSQVNKFNQLNNPDYVYFDLQQTNIYNTTTQEQQPLKFLETRETPIIKNTGDYYMSVARFQLDTYNLPVIVGEPDLTQTGTFDPDKTIYKVGLEFTNNAITSLFNSSFFEPTDTLDSRAGFGANYGKYVALAKPENSDTKINLAIGVPADKAIDLWSGTAPYASRSTFYTGNSDETEIGKTLGISDSGLYIVSGGRYGTYLWNTQTRQVTKITDLNSSTQKLQTATISGNGSTIVIGRIDLGQFQVFTNTNGSVNPLITPITVTASGYTPSIVANAGSGFSSQGIKTSSDGSIIVISDPWGNGTNGAIFVYERDVGTTVYTQVLVRFGSAGQYLGFSFDLSSDGQTLLVGAPYSGLPFTGNGVGQVRYFRRNSFNNWVEETALPVPNPADKNFGYSVSLSRDGQFAHASTAKGNGFFRFFRNTIDAYIATTPALDQLIPNIAPASYDYQFILTANTGNSVITGRYTETGTLSKLAYQTVRTRTFNQPYNVPIMSPTIESVKWIKDVEDVTAPTQNSLTGKNTALYPYYYCYSYNNFITMVNKALKLAYKNFIEKIYQQWVFPIQTNNSWLVNPFLDIVTRQYPNPPFIEWDEQNLTADVYVTLLFETYQKAANAVIHNINYAIPKTTWATVSSNYVGTPLPPTPFKFELSFNAPLYSLFNSIPATKKILTDDFGKKELYYTLNFYSSGLGLITPSPALNSIIPYSFLSTYTNATTGVVTIPTAETVLYSQSGLLIKQSQEISTIDTWTPVNAIVFTTTSIPIVVNQFTASSSIGSNPPTSSLDNAFAFIITDLQSNQQGYRPNILLTPKIYRMIDLTGNQPLKNIDINVFWRTKTGNLIPFTLASGAMSSIKLLFQKKVLGENQQINMAAMTMRDVM
jgi:hypothetical protein